MLIRIRLSKGSCLDWIVEELEIEPGPAPIKPVSQPGGEI